MYGYNYLEEVFTKELKDLLEKYKVIIIFKDNEFYFANNANTRDKEIFIPLSLFR